MEKEEELVDMDEKGNIIKSENQKDNRGLPFSSKILIFIVILIIIIVGAFYTLKNFKRMNHIELIIANDYEEMSLRAADIFKI